MSKGFGQENLLETRKGIKQVKKKEDLYKLAKTLKERPLYQVEKLIEGTEHKILWLPPHHCLYNAIELVRKHPSVHVADIKVMDWGSR